MQNRVKQGTSAAAGSRVTPRDAERLNIDGQTSPDAANEYKRAQIHQGVRVRFAATCKVPGIQDATNCFICV